MLAEISHAATNFLRGRKTPVTLFEPLGIKEELKSIGDRTRGKLSQVISPNGILASEDMRFHHLFGRDTNIVAHFINAAYQDKPHDQLWHNTKASVFGFWDFQREDGKVRHEVKPFNWKEMKKAAGFYYQVGEYMVNDDSVDATPLALITAPEFIETREEFINFLPKAVKALDWMTQSMDKKNGWLSYSYNPHGLTHQGWMDSRFSVMHNNGELPKDPVALVEVQAYTWKAMRMWADLLQDDIPDISRELSARADDLKRRFNKQFIMHDSKGAYFTHALDGHGNQIKNVSINPGLALWANYQGESIMDEKCVPSVVARLIGEDMFDKEAGVRTFERGEPIHDKEGYHNGEGVYWPFATTMTAKGILEMGYADEAEEIMLANLVPLRHFGSFVEQFSKNGSYALFRNGEGEDCGCHNQTWTMAVALWTANQLL